MSRPEAVRGRCKLNGRGGTQCPSQGGGRGLLPTGACYIHACVLVSWKTQERNQREGSLAEIWKQLDEQDKSRFTAVAADDKSRYDAAVASNPANGAVKRKKASKRTGRKKLSAYMHFCADRRPSLTAELKASMGSTYKTPAVMSALGAEWRLLDASSKARFEQMAAVPVE